MNHVKGLSATTVNTAHAQPSFDTLINVAPEGQPKAVLAAWVDSPYYDEGTPPSAEQIAYHNGRFQDVSWAFLEAERADCVRMRNGAPGTRATIGHDETEKQIDAIEAQYYPTEFAALLVERAKIKAEMEAAFKATKLPEVEAMRPDALLTCLAPNSTPDKGQVPTKPIDPKALSVPPEKRDSIYPPMIIEDYHPPRDAIKTNLPQGGY